MKLNLWAALAASVILCASSGCSTQPETLKCGTGQIECAGVCTNALTDNANCGACGAVCQPGTACNGGACQPTCAANRTSCEGLCADLQTDRLNCGACGTTCGSGEVCSGGVCAVSCQQGLTDCAGTCTDTNSDTAHCGACGNACAQGEACVGGGCQVSCRASQTPCDGTCVTLASDGANCGACGNACDPGEVCSNGTCQLSCQQGLTDCSGSCVNAQTDVANCGGCGVACDAGEVCSNGTCQLSCQQGLTECDGTCVNVQSDRANCGACGTGCDAGEVCSNGVCELSCQANLTACDGACVNTQTDDANCGGCGNTCPMGQVCSSGSCQVSCQPGLEQCGATCTNTQYDPQNCGGCGNACATYANATTSCNGQCFSTCEPSFADCNGQSGDGCEVDTRSNAANCGACGAVCPPAANASTTCISSTCGFQCNSGRADCDGLASTGCEATLNTVQHCGGCYNTCPSRPFAAPACSNGTCVLSCVSNRANCDNVQSNGCEADLLNDEQHCGGCGTVCGSGKTCVNGTCQGAGVFAFGEFRPAIACNGFTFNGADYRQYCFTLKGQTLCIGQNQGGAITCAPITNGIRFTFDYPATWPMRFTLNSSTCQNYNSDFMQHLAWAIGYANFSISQTKTGNSCALTWLDSNGIFTAAPGNTGKALPYVVDFTN